MKKLVLKPLSLNDTDLIFASIKGNVAEYFYNFKSKSEVREWVTTAIEAHKNRRKLEFMIFDSNKFIGMISPCYLTNKKVEIGMWIATDKQRKGYGTKAMNELLEQLKSEGIKEVIYETEFENEQSIRLATSCGFVATNKGAMVRFTKIVS